MTIEFAPDVRGILSPHRLVTQCCGGICLTRGEYSAQQTKVQRGFKLECPRHGTVDEAIRWDLEWYFEFTRIGVKEVNSEVNMSKEIR